MEKRQKIVLMPLGSEYRVVGLTNRLKPGVETILQLASVKELISMKHLDVDIVRKEKEGV